MQRAYSADESERVNIKNDLFFVEEVLFVLSGLYEQGELEAAPKESIRTLLTTSIKKLRNVRSVISGKGEIEEKVA